MISPAPLLPVGRVDLSTVASGYIYHGFAIANTKVSSDTFVQLFGPNTSGVILMGA